MSSDKPHSAEYFNDLRDLWWNPDFLELMGKRLNLGAVSSVLDVGSGVGHWGRALAPVLPEHATLIGIDREPQWIQEATARAAKAGLTPRFRYQRGDAQRLDFPDSSFDLVTCQTVLMHLPEPLTALREMLRVVRPGGLILASEPNNLASAANIDSLHESRSIDEVVDEFRFSLICQRGKKALGEGFNSLGELVPGMLASLGATDIRVNMPDRAMPLYPPYQVHHQRVLIAQIRDWAKRDFCAWDNPTTKRYFLAGGGSESEFERHWQRLRRRAADVLTAIDAGTYHEAGAWLGVLTSGRKPVG